MGCISARDSEAWAELSPAFIVRRVNLRVINADLKHELNDVCAVKSLMRARLQKRVAHIRRPFEQANEALILYGGWGGNQRMDVQLLRRQMAHSTLFAWQW